jgi:S1-C subfamily serine protease
VGDLIVSAGGQSIADADDLQDALGKLSAPYELVVVRGADEQKLTVKEVETKAQRTPGDA